MPTASCVSIAETAKPVIIELNMVKRVISPLSMKLQTKNPTGMDCAAIQIARVLQD